MGDLAAGPRRCNSLSEKGILPRVCCMAPGLSLFFLYGLVVVSSIFATNFFYTLCAALTFVTGLWITNLALSSMLGAIYMRRETSMDWSAQLEELQREDRENTEVMHIVLLPNYKENECMLKETLENLGSAPGAQETLHIVLAMEVREGPSGREKAERLIAETAHLFADVTATFHPDGLPGEVPGKSSNTQWAYRECLRRYGQKFQGRDLTRVFITIGDADTLWHPQYFNAMAVQALKMPQEERFWKMWQPPILLMRNIWTVPNVTRASAHASLIFELAGLANQAFFPAFCFSAYSLTLALASHPEVDGWDVDVIAEDHHMFLKCYFASLWEQHHWNKFVKNQHRDDESALVKPQVQVQPIFLPAVSYLVESSEGWWPSVTARFHQARRHMQGVVELGYALLQYVRLVSEAGVSELPVQTHAAVWSILLKMQTLHITSTCQCFALIIATATSVGPGIVRWVLAGGIWELMASSQSLMASASDGWGALGLAEQALAASFGQISGVVLFYSAIVYIVMMDLFEGRYYCTENGSLHKPKGRTQKESEAGDHDGSDKLPSDIVAEGKPTKPAWNAALSSFVMGRMGWTQRLSILMGVYSDTGLVGYVTLTFFAMLPVVMAAWSLIRRGAEFEYIVAAKPE